MLSLGAVSQTDPQTVDNVTSLSVGALLRLVHLAHERELCDARSPAPAPAADTDVARSVVVPVTDTAGELLAPSPGRAAEPLRRASSFVARASYMTSVSKAAVGVLEEGGADDDDRARKPSGAPDVAAPEKRPSLFSSSSVGWRMLEELRRAEHSLKPTGRFSKGPVDLIMSFLVVASTVSLFVELELRGYELGDLLSEGGAPGKREPEVWAPVRVFEQVVNAIFLLELFFQFWIARWLFFWHPVKRQVKWFNCLDVVIVLICSFDLYVSPELISEASSGAQSNFAALRLLQLLRLSRGLRVIRVMTMFSKLRVLLLTTASSFMALFWAMLLMLLFMYGSALSLCQLLQSAIQDQSLPLELRVWIFKHYGTGSRSVWTLYEITLSGGWPSYCRRLIDEVHWSYALFFAVYVWVVVFAVTRIISALFLKDTLQIADEDREMMMREHKARKANYTRKLHALFALADKSGDGVLSLAEFREVAENPEAQVYFVALDLQLAEVCELFAMLDGGDGTVSYDEFCTGIMRLKGQARSMDVISMMRECRYISTKLDALESCLDARLGVHGVAQRNGEASVCHGLGNATRWPEGGVVMV